MNTNLVPTEADAKISECIDNEVSFSVIAGAGSGKTTSLVEALKRIRVKRGETLRKNGQRVVCVTYTCLLYTSPSPRDRTRSRMPSSA